MIRRGLALATILWLLPSPAYAHTVGPGAGVEMELLLLALATLVIGFRLRSSRRTRWWVAWVAMATGVGLAALAIALPQMSAPGRPAGVSLVISTPKTGDTVAAGSPVEIEISLDGASIARSASDSGKGHLHIHVDGTLQQMPFATSSKVTLSAGSHELLVEYVDPQHVSYDPPIQTAVQVEAI